MGTPVGLAALAAVLLAFVAACIVDVVRREPKLLPRWLWILICIASVPLGAVAYLVFGRGERPEPAPTPAATATAPGPPVPPAPAPPRSRPAQPVRTEGLTKRYGDHAALDGVDLAVPAGSVFGLVGPNGAGKTTLLSILAGLRTPTAGAVSFGDPATTVALLADTPHFEPWLTAREVINLAGQLTAPQAAPGRVDQVLSQAGLADASDRRVGGFSRGMLQRLGLAATVIGDPDVLLLDEPCSALDPVGRREVLDFVGRLGGSHTVVFCSHILDDVQEVCDQVGVLRAGRLLFQGPLGDLLVGGAAPACRVRLRPPAAPVADALAAEPWVTAVEQLGAEELRVVATSLDEAEQHLAAALAASGARVVSIVPAGADLERVFLELVR